MSKNKHTTSSKNKAQTDIQKCTETASVQYKGPKDEPPHKKASISSLISRENTLYFAAYSGLVNQGATCYLNATLQTLFMTEEFRKAIMLKGKNEENKESFSKHLRELFISLDSKEKIAFAHGVTEALGIKCANEQQDAAEYYQKILNMIEPEAVKMFQGTVKNSTVCPENHEYTEENVFFCLAISMDSSLVSYDSINVQNSFNAQFEKMRGDDRMYCEKCKKQSDMNVMCTISELPDILTLQLKRFKFNYSNATYIKNEHQAEIPFQLKVKDESGVDYQYDLYAIINHVGSLSDGHYYAKIKSFEDQQWYEFNDSLVHWIDLHGRQLPNHIISKEAYLLFFKKQQGQEQSNTVTTAPLVATDDPKPLQYEHKDSCSATLQRTAGADADTKAEGTSDEGLKETLDGQTCFININADSKIDKISSAEIKETTPSGRSQQQKNQGKEERVIQRANSFPGQQPSFYQRDWNPPHNPLSEIVENLEKTNNSISGTAEAPDAALCKLKKEQRYVEDAVAAPSDSSSAEQGVSSSSSQETEITCGADPKEDIQSLKIQKLKAKIELLEIKKEYYTQKLKKLTSSQGFSM